MLTQFGKFIRKFRIDNAELLKGMADKLEVTSSYLSAVENGKRNIPDDWFEKLCDFYKMSDYEKNELKNAIDSSITSIKVSLENMNSNDKNLFVRLAREFDGLDEMAKIKIEEIFNKKGDANA